MTSSFSKFYVSLVGAVVSFEVDLNIVDIFSTE